MSTLGYMGGFMRGGRVSDDAASVPAAAPAADQPDQADDQTHHWWRLLAVWVVLSAILDPLFYFLAGPHIPPGTMTDTAAGAQFDFNVLFVIALPVLLGVWIYMIYAIAMWSASRGGPEPVGGPAARGNLGIQVGWILVTTVIVLFLAGSAPTSWCNRAARVAAKGRARSGPRLRRPSCPMQVIGQQWKFTYRYPTFGGFETDQLVVPDNTTIQFNVTSLDVIHSFWAYQLGVKADANPDYNNVAYTTTQQLGSFTVRCAELCGLWHGAMYNNGAGGDTTAVRVLGQGHRIPAATRTPSCCRPIALTYTPDANGADGGYYPDNVDPYSKVETYGATKAKGS